MEKIFSAYSAAKGRTLRGDFTDRLHSQHTVTFLLAVLILLVSKQYSGSAISCWLPKQFSGDQEGYIHQFCWINNTYYYPHEKDPDQFSEQPKYVIQYYQYILFILSAQIMLFFIPSLLWKTIASDSGSYINKLLDSVDKNKVFQSECANAEEPVELPKFPLHTVSEEHEVTMNSSVNSDISRTSAFEKKRLLSNQFAEKFKNEFNSLKTSLNRTSSLKPESKEKKRLHDKEYEAQQSNIVNMGQNEPEFTMNVSPIPPPKKKKSFIKNNFKKMRMGKVIIKPIRGVKNLALFYFGMKFFNLGNVLLQLFGLRFIFGADFWRYGFDYMHKIYNIEDPLWMSEQFPIVTICDYYIHQNLRRVHWNSSQCLLAINVLIEKFYVFIWLWLYILVIITFFNIISWFLEIYSSSRYKFLFKYLRIKERMSDTSHSRSRFHKQSRQDQTQDVMFNIDSPLTKENVQSFQKEFLGYDGLVMMHMVKNVAGDMIFMDLISGLWVEYLRKKLD